MKKKIHCSVARVRKVNSFFNEYFTKNSLGYFFINRESNGIVLQGFYQKDATKTTTATTVKSIKGHSNVRQRTVLQNRPLCKLKCICHIVGN